MLYEVHYEIATSDNRVVSAEMSVVADSEERAVEFVGEMLDQQYDEGSVLLECQVVSQREE